MGRICPHKRDWDKYRGGGSGIATGREKSLGQTVLSGGTWDQHCGSGEAWDQRWIRGTWDERWIRGSGTSIGSGGSGISAGSGGLG